MSSRKALSEGADRGSTGRGTQEASATASRCIGHVLLAAQKTYQPPACRGERSDSSVNGLLSDAIAGGSSGRIDLNKASLMDEPPSANCALFRNACARLGSMRRRLCRPIKPRLV